jgi:hypothetical protein
MPLLRLEWTVVSRPMFEHWRSHFTAIGRGHDFSRVHNQIVTVLTDSEQAMEKGEALFNTRKPGGLVRLWVHEFISVCYVVFPQERLGWILRYQCTP